jgi:putative molybdopterin biosynthesis protein
MTAVNEPRSLSLKPSLKKVRAQSGLTQEELARMVGLSRQSLNQIENGSAVCSTAISLRLARALGCRVEDIFALRDAGELRATLAQPLGELKSSSSRTVLGAVNGKWVAHRLNPLQRVGDLAIAADALLVKDAGPAKSALVRLKPLGEVSRISENLLVAGCDPALGLLADRAARGASGTRTVWLEAASGAALGALARAEVHLAGAHLFDEESGDYNVPFVQRAFAGRAMIVITVAQIEEGLAVAKGNPHQIKKLAHLTRPGVRIINRSQDAGARKLLDRLLAAGGIPAASIAGYEQNAPGHLEAAQAVAHGAADAAMVTCSAAIAFGLDFLPLASERFDLALSKESLSDPRISRLLETLSGAPFRQELAAIGGYQTRRSGAIAAELP